MKRRPAEMRWLDAADIIEAKITRYIHGLSNAEWIQYWLNVVVDDKSTILKLVVYKH